MASMKPYTVNGKVVPNKWRIRWRDEYNRSKSKTIKGKGSASVFLREISAKELGWRMNITSATSERDDNLRKWTVKDLGEKFVDEYLSKSKAAGNKSYVNRIITKWHNYRLYQISPELVRPWILQFVMGSIRKDNGEKYPASTIRKHAVYFRWIFSWAVDMGYIPHNPLEKLMTKKFSKKIGKPRKRKVMPTYEQFWKLEKNLPYWLRNVCICAWETGMRAGEIRNLTWGKVDLKAKFIYLDDVDVKEHDDKKVAISNRLHDVLSILKMTQPHCDNDLVFYSAKGHKIEAVYLSKAFRRETKSAGIRDLHIHDIRRAYVTYKRRQGYDKSVIMANVGHSNEHINNIYDTVGDFELLQMAGVNDKNFAKHKAAIRKLVNDLSSDGITLGDFQNYLTEIWRQEEAA